MVSSFSVRIATVGNILMVQTLICGGKLRMSVSGGIGVWVGVGRALDVRWWGWKTKWFTCIQPSIGNLQINVDHSELHRGIEGRSSGCNWHTSSLKLVSEFWLTIVFPLGIKKVDWWWTKVPIGTSGLLDKTIEGEGFYGSYNVDV